MDVEDKGGEQKIPVQNPPHKSILNKTLGEILHTEDEAQQRIMKGMNIDKDQFQQMLGKTEGNKYMNMTIAELFKSGFIQQAMKQFGSGQAPSQLPQNQVGPVISSDGTVQQPEEIETSGDELKEMVETQNAQVLETDEVGNPTRIAVPVAQKKPSFGEFIKGLFR